MGCNGSKTEEEKVAKKKSQDIERELKRGRRNNDELKLLLLGTGESGKSTFAKQMRYLHTDERFSDEYRVVTRELVFQNILSSLKLLIKNVPKFELKWEEAEKELVDAISSASLVDATQFPKDLAEKITTLWKTPTMTTMCTHASEIQLPDSTFYFIENLPRISEENYLPSDQDILRVRLRTSGIVETKFQVKQTKFKLLDVGGQRNERKKWIHCFEDVTALIFIVALNEYDMKLYEDETVCRMKESLELFEEIVNSRWFIRTAVILFFSKIDLFMEKIKRVKFSDYFPDYKGDNQDADEIFKFITLMFHGKNQNNRKMIFTKVACLVDSKTVEAVFDSCREIIVSESLKQTGITF